MSRLVVHDGIGYGASTNAFFYTDDSKIFTSPKELLQVNSSKLWTLWGDTDDDAVLIADDIANCGVLSAGIDAEARFATGKGPEPYLLVNKDKDGNETLEWVDDPEIGDFLELNRSYEYSYINIYNMLAYGWGCSQVILNKGRNRINRIKATDVFQARLEKKDKFGNINNVFLCADWSQAPATYDADKIKRITALTEQYELQELQELQDSTSGVEFAVLHRLMRNGAQYYPRAMHRSAVAWVKISRSIPAIKAAINANQMMIKYVVIIAENYWKRIHPDWDSYEAEKKQEIVTKKYKEINDFLTGEINAGKSIIAGSYYDQHAQQFVDDIKITVLDDKMKDGRYLPDGAAADKQILFAIMFNPAIWGGNLLGDGASGGAGSGSDIREATLVLQTLLNPERSANLTVLNIVKNFNGWGKRLEIQRDVFPVTAPGTTNTATLTRKKIMPRLVWRYNNAVLTTLDTGRSQKQTNN